jgi:plastocyanin
VTTQRAAVGRTIVVVVVALVLVVGVVSALYLPRVLYPSKIMTVGVGMSSNYLTLISKFTPKNITVVIGVNNTVQWTNNDQYPTPIYHTVTEGKPVVVPVTTNKCSIPVKGTLGPFQCPTATPFFDSGNIQKNGTFTYTFTTPGVYEYFCVYHPGMVGFVIVKQ